MKQATCSHDSSHVSRFGPGKSSVAATSVFAGKLGSSTWQTYSYGAKPPEPPLIADRT